MAPQSHAQGAGSTPQHLSRQQWGPRARAASSALTCLRSATGVAGGGWLRLSLLTSAARAWGPCSPRRRQPRGGGRKPAACTRPDRGTSFSDERGAVEPWKGHVLWDPGYPTSREGARGRAAGLGGGTGTGGARAVLTRQGWARAITRRPNLRPVLWTPVRRPRTGHHESYRGSAGMQGAGEGVGTPVRCGGPPASPGADSAVPTPSETAGCRF